MEILSSRIVWSGTAPGSIETHDDGWYQATWAVPANRPFAASCRLACAGTKEPFWCMPGLFWGDNQQDSTGQYYPRFRADLSQPQKFESAFWEFHVFRLAQPLAAMHDGTDWWILEVKPETGGLHASVGFEFESGCPTLVASLPANERPYRPVGHDYTMPVIGMSTSETARTISWSFRAMKITGYRTAVLDILETNYHSTPSRPVSATSASDCGQATRNALLRWHYDPNKHYFRYTVAFDRVGQQIAEAQGGSLDRHEMPLGWVSGWVVFEALLDWATAHDDKVALCAVEDTWKGLVAAGVTSPCGYWWTRYDPPRSETRGPFDSRTSDGFDGNWMVDSNHLHLRTLGDAVWRATRSLRKHSEVLSFSKSLLEQVVTQASHVAGLVRQGWPIPLSVDARTGEPAGLRGTAGMIWISVWSELVALGCWEDVDLIAIGLDHHRADVESGELFGAPEDVGECVTSEDIYIAVNTYLDGYRVTKRPEDLETAVHAARWLYVWRKSFNHVFDPRTVIGIYNLKSRGGDLASFKNNHLHLYGLDVEDSLVELSRLTGDDRWQQLAEDHWEFAAQLTPLVDGHFNAYEGMVTEQFYFIDWSALNNSVRLFEKDEHRSHYDVGPHYRNYGNLAGFSHAWCTAFVLRSALRREATSNL